MVHVKTVVIDCRFAHFPAGIGRYTRELVPLLLPRLASSKIVLIVMAEGKPWAAALAGGSEVMVARGAHYAFREQWEIPSLLRAAHADLFFAPHFNVPFFCPVPFVCTIHDLILHRYPNQATLPKRMAYRILMQRSVRRARRVIAVSRFTAEELARVFGGGIVSKTTVIHNGVSGIFHSRSAVEQDEAVRTFGIQRPFFLYVGNAKEHKNVPMLLSAFERSGRGDAELVLALSGREASSLHLSPRVRLLSDLHDDALAALYSAALAFVTPSLYEGFGLPVAEAAACGCPVIAVKGSSIPEVAPEGSILLPPTVDALADALRNAREGERPAVCRFSWEETAEKTADVLRVAMS